MYSIKYIGDGQVQETIDINKIIKVSSRPVIPPVSPVVYTTDLGDGTKYYEEAGYFQDRSFSLNCGFTAEEPDEWQRVAATIQDYFKVTSGKLYLPDDDAETFWKVKFIQVGFEQRVMGQMTTVGISVVAHTYQYISRFYDRPFDIAVGNSAQTQQVIHNPYDSSSPLYLLHYVNSDEDVAVHNSVTNFESTLTKPFVSLVDGKTVDYVEINPDEYTIRQVYTDGTSQWCNKMLRGRFDSFYLPSGHTTLTFKPSGNVGFNVELYRRFSKR